MLPPQRKKNPHLRQKAFVSEDGGFTWAFDWSWVTVQKWRMWLTVRSWQQRGVRRQTLKTWRVCLKKAFYCYCVYLLPHWNNAVYFCWYINTVYQERSAGSVGDKRKIGWGSHLLVDWGNHLVDQSRFLPNISKRSGAQFGGRFNLLQQGW